jgi:hypothetical protein
MIAHAPRRKHDYQQGYLNDGLSGRLVDWRARRNKPK